MHSFLFIAFFGTIFLCKSSETCDQYNFDEVLASHQTTNPAVPRVSSVQWTRDVIVVSQNYTEFIVNWDPPVIQNGSLLLCAYSIHYKSVATGNGKMIYVSPNSTQINLTNLEAGTSYLIYVDVIFDNPSSVLTSIQTIEKTLGFGPDHTCRCNVTGTLNHDVNDCDRFIETVKCHCKNVETAGDRCDQCIYGAYWDPSVGCATCDQCSSLGSDTSCHLTSQGVIQCHCVDGFIGRRCDQCNRGYYPVEDHCIQCNCNGNENPYKPVCDNKGVCLSCVFPTTGDNCESCLPGFNGDALKHTCVRASDVRNHNIVIGVLVAILGVVLIVLLILGARHLLRRRQRATGLKGLSAIAGSIVQFSTLQEEPATINISTLDLDHTHTTITN